MTIALGVLAAAALPPFYLLPLLIPAFSGLFLLTLNARSARQAFFYGWWWGLGHFAAGLYWICISLYVEPEKFAWLTPFALFGLPSVIAIYIGLVTCTLYCIHTRWPSISVPMLSTFFAALWIVAEYARAHLFTGFPWNLIGYVWNISDVTLQADYLWGIYGQSWLGVTLATLPALLLLHERAAKPLNSAGALLLVAVIGFGAWRLTNPTEYTSTHLRLVQANIAQATKFDPTTMMEGLRKHVALTRKPGLDKIDLVIWPETAVPYLMEAGSPLLQDLGSMLPEHTQLLTGGMRAEGQKENWKAWNSAFLINAAGSITAQYDKYHLVPFGEYIPFRNLLPIDAIAGGMGDFSTGPGPSTLISPALPPFSVLICYEAIFPDRATDSSSRAEWLANLTNDAWFGFSSGPFQHLEMARARAVEEAIPLIRAANTGISSVIDSYGRVLKRLPIGVSGTIDSALPTAIQSKSIHSGFRQCLILLLIVINMCFTYFITIRSTLKII